MLQPRKINHPLIKNLSKGKGNKRIPFVLQNQSKKRPLFACEL